MSEKLENTPLEFSTIDPMTEAAGLEAVLGMINPKEDLGQVENDSVPEAELEEFEEEYSEEELMTKWKKHSIKLKTMSWKKVMSQKCLVTSSLTTANTII